MGTLESWRAYAAWTALDRSVPEAREFVRLQLAARGLWAVSADVVLVASELATNATTHGGAGFEVTLECAPAFLTLTVGDPSPELPVVLRVDATARHGRGMALVEALSSEWGVTRDGVGKQVWACFPVQPTTRGI